MTRLLLLVPIALALISPTMAPAVVSHAPSPEVPFSPPRHVVYAHFAQSYKVKPKLLEIGNFEIEEMVWGDWSAPVVIGEGVFPYNDCHPNCASGHIARYPGTIVTLGRIVRCPRSRAHIYTRLKYVLPPGAPTRGPALTMSCSGRFKGFHEL